MKPHQCAMPEPARGEGFLPHQCAALTDLEWKSRQPSLSAAVGAVIERAKQEPDLRSKETQ